MQHFFHALKHALDFSGRASRTQYWMFVLVFAVVNLVLRYVDVKTGTFSPTWSMGLLSGLWTFFLLIPGISAMARRLHDIGRSGWWQLMIVIPIIGFIVLLFMLVRPSEPRTNTFGRNPLGFAT